MVHCTACHENNFDGSPHDCHGIATPCTAACWDNHAIGADGKRVLEVELDFLDPRFGGMTEEYCRPAILEHACARLKRKRGFTPKMFFIREKPHDPEIFNVAHLIITKPTPRLVWSTIGINDLDPTFILDTKVTITIGHPGEL